MLKAKMLNGRALHKYASTMKKLHDAIVNVRLFQLRPTSEVATVTFEAFVKAEKMIDIIFKVNNVESGLLNTGESIQGI